MCLSWQLLRVQVRVQELVAAARAGAGVGDLGCRGMGSCVCVCRCECTCLQHMWQRGSSVHMYATVQCLAAVLARARVRLLAPGRAASPELLHHGMHGCMACMGAWRAWVHGVHGRRSRATLGSHTAPNKMDRFSASQLRQELHLECVQRGPLLGCDRERCPPKSPAGPALAF